MRISDWSSDVCSSDLEFLHLRNAPLDFFGAGPDQLDLVERLPALRGGHVGPQRLAEILRRHLARFRAEQEVHEQLGGVRMLAVGENARRRDDQQGAVLRSEEHTSELQSLMRTSYAVFCLKKKTEQTT